MKAGEVRNPRINTTLPDPVRVNVGFWRRVGRETQQRNVQNVELPLDLWIASSPEARTILMKSKPEGDGWMIGGYALVKGQEKT